MLYLPRWYICPKCGWDLPRTVDFWHLSRHGTDGLARYCKPCARDAASRSYHADPAKRRAQIKDWQARNPDKVQGYIEAYKRKAHAKVLAKRILKWKADRDRQVQP